ncbi:hypothetical protein [Rhodococcus artemisiae]|uniref:Uncharacterized protein n=1 Tax=Rhodococcus artemisiae TaxID=714159 RepID=A0ABU7LJF6_9NOCA|nr:hypothetical protein [Rhodococcus artemisiae]MEE2061700.1 hypothetical protein [Rhodococcus artemisiae]
MMLERFRLRRRLNRNNSDRAAGAAWSEAEAGYSEEVAAAWHALDDEVKEDLLAAAEELKQVREQYGITTVFHCYRSGPPRCGPLRTPADIRAEAESIRASVPSASSDP